MLFSLRLCTGVKQYTNVIVCGTTNRFHDLDPALLRPGRFDTHISIAPPDSTQREQIIQELMKPLSFASKFGFALSLIQSLNRRPNQSRH